MDMTNEQYQALVGTLAKPSPCVKNSVWAFLVGGSICALGQWLSSFYRYTCGLDKDWAGSAVSVTLIALSAALTGAGVYDRLAKLAGAGTLVPITGFANAVVSPAMEFRTEGLVSGVGAKLFTIAGPVLVYGLAAAVVYGMILAVLGLA